VKTGDHDVLLWQSSQIFVVFMCVGCLPVASTPLWQLKQFPEMFAWSKTAGTQRALEWQSSQRSLEMIWLGGFPVDWMPLWQVPQLPDTAV